MRIYLAISVISCILAPSLIEGRIKLIVWDLGGTMVDVSILGMMRTIGTIDCLKYHFGYTTAQDQLQHKMFDTLEKCFGKQQGSFENLSYHTAHRPLPAIMCHWLAGTYGDTNEILHAQLQARLPVLYEQGYFMNELEYRLVSNALKHMFTPDTLIKHTYIVKKAYALAEKIHRKQSCRQTIFSNWDLWSFPMLQESEVGHKLNEIFDWNFAIISGVLKQLKPQTTIYETLCRFWSVEPEECLIIDDQKEMVDKARRLGFQAFWVPDKDFIEVEKYLLAEGVL